MHFKAERVMKGNHEFKSQSIIKNLNLQGTGTVKQTSRQ